MKLEIKGIQILGGEFKIHSPESVGLAQPGSGNQLLVACQFGLLSKSGNVLASGYASNSPTA